MAALLLNGFIIQIAWGHIHEALVTATTQIYCLALCTIMFTGCLTKDLRAAKLRGLGKYGHETEHFRRTEFLFLRAFCPVGVACSIPADRLYTYYTLPGHTYYVKGSLKSFLV
jgi:hypothetical protein